MKKVTAFARLIERATGAENGVHSFFVSQNEAVACVEFLTEMYRAIHIALMPLGTGKIHLQVYAFGNDDSHASYDFRTRFNNLDELLSAINNESLEAVYADVFGGCELLNR